MLLRIDFQLDGDFEMLYPTLSPMNTAALLDLEPMSGI